MVHKATEAPTGPGLMPSRRDSELLFAIPSLQLPKSQMRMFCKPYFVQAAGLVPAFVRYLKMFPSCDANYPLPITTDAASAALLIIYG